MQSPTEALNIGADVAKEEIVVACALGSLATRSPIPPLLWRWINDRGDFSKEPSVAEQFDMLLKILSGKSLKDHEDLWTAFSHLREARNNFVHEERLMLGRGKNKRPLSDEDARCRPAN